MLLHPTNMEAIIEWETMEYHSDYLLRHIFAKSGRWISWNPHVYLSRAWVSWVPLDTLSTRGPALEAASSDGHSASRTFVSSMIWITRLSHDLKEEQGKFCEFFRSAMSTFVWGWMSCETWPLSWAVFSPDIPRKINNTAVLPWTMNRQRLNFWSKILTKLGKYHNEWLVRFIDNWTRFLMLCS